MASPNAQLEAALKQFASQSGVTPEQVAQLRSAVVADSQQLGLLNQDAQNGHLKAFALQGSTGQQNLAGSYDIQSGTVTLPAADFQSSGARHNPDLQATLRLQHMSIEFSQKTYLDASRATHPVTQDMVNNLQSTINGSPVLADEIKRAVMTTDKGDPPHKHLEHFDFIPPGFTAGGTYSASSHSMNMPAARLQARSAANPNGYDPNDMTFVLGHEIQHGFNAPERRLANAAFHNDAISIAKSTNPVHDYTRVFATSIQASRDDEAKAEISGWNALLSRQKQGNPSAGLPEMNALGNRRIEDFIVKPQGAGTTIQPRPGLSFDPDGQLQMSPKNVAAMGQHYFNRPDPTHAIPGRNPIGIGDRGTSDYPNYYATSGVEHIVEYERKYARPIQGVMPAVTVNMASVGMKEPIIEAEGLDFGKNKAPFPYYDSSTTPPVLHHFDHTQDGSVNPAHDHKYVPVAPTPSSTPAQHGPDEPGHPDHAMLEQIRDGMRKIDESVGKPYDEMSERASRCLLAACKDNRESYPGAADRSMASNALTRVDHVVMSKTGNLFAVEGRLDDPASKRVHVQIDQAINIPLEQSDQKLLAANQAIAQERQVTQQQELARGVNDPNPSGPTR
ncbi:XVIPCD domain-containing protein [Xanthomonas sp. 3075]|uniref:XVIPCD domain-containing protein n=1 Tax=Xanthomonas sp. 3075 TaxID=3035315 RepID=UPI00161584B3|nr:XVIPCD domain-containing protein [Xanthomonas sp. 3075]MBB4133010.1 hypothetical protein [Xanthomonas sp. 3075]